MQLLNDGRSCDQVDEFFLLVLFLLRVIFCFVRVIIVLEVEFVDHRTVDRPFQEFCLLHVDKAAAAMCV